MGGGKLALARSSSRSRSGIGRRRLRTGAVRVGYSPFAQSMCVVVEHLTSSDVAVAVRLERTQENAT